MRWNLTAALCAAGLGLSASVAAATPHPQRAADRDSTALDAHWIPWIGCWTPESGAGAGSAGDICIVPAATGSGVEVIHTDHSAPPKTLEAGTPVSVNEGGCAGTRELTWSADGYRAYEETNLTCAGGTTRRASAMLAFTGDSTWTWIHSTTVAGRQAAHEQSFSLASPAPAVADRLSGLALAAETARLNVDHTLTAGALAEASKTVGSKAVILYLLARSDTTHVDASVLGALADHHVPTDVINVMVALSYPTAFTVSPVTMTVASREVMPNTRPETVTYPAGGYYGGYGSAAPSYGWYGAYGFGYPGYFGLNSLYYGYGYPGSYGYGYPGYYGYNGGLPPVIVVGSGGAASTSQGRVVNGRGYVSPGGQITGQARPRSAPASRPPSTPVYRPRSAPAPSARPAPAPSAPRQSTGRTAHRRGH